MCSKNNFGQELKVRSPLGGIHRFVSGKRRNEAKLGRMGSSHVLALILLCPTANATQIRLLTSTETRFPFIDGHHLVRLNCSRRDFDPNVES